MSRKIRFLILAGILLMSTLACNAITRPLNQAQEMAATVESIATALPVETLMAIPSMLPTEFSGFDLTRVPGPGATSQPGVPDCFDPKDEPLKEWNGIPIMPQATAGAECADLYAFTTALSPEDVKAYYNEALANLGWQSFAGMEQNEAGGLFLIYQKEGEIVSVVITPAMQGEGIWLVMLTKG